MLHDDTLKSENKQNNAALRASQNRDFEGFRFSALATAYLWSGLASRPTRARPAVLGQFGLRFWVVSASFTRAKCSRLPKVGFTAESTSVAAWAQGHSQLQLRVNRRDSQQCSLRHQAHRLWSGPGHDLVPLKDVLFLVKPVSMKVTYSFTRSVGDPAERGSVRTK